MTPHRRNGPSAGPLFPVGALIFSVGVDTLVRQGQLDPLPYLHRHLSGDWGDLDDADWETNDHALQNGARLLSQYRINPDLTLLIISEANRCKTTLLLSEER